MVTVIEQVARQVRATTNIVEDYIDASLQRLSEAGVVIEKDQEATQSIAREINFINKDVSINMLGKEVWTPTLEEMKKERKALIRTIELLHK